MFHSLLFSLIIAMPHPFFIIHNILTKIERYTKDIFSNSKVPQPLIYLGSWKNHQMLPWQMNSTFIIVLFLFVLSQNALPRLSSRSRQSQNTRLCKHIGTLCSLLRVFCKGFRGYDDML